MSFDIKVFGASHDKEIGLCANGLPSGEEINLEVLQEFLDRRRPGTSDSVSQRKEFDTPKFISGIKVQDDNTLITTGEPFEVRIENTDVRQSDYSDLLYTPRPGHADFTAYTKYGLDYDMSGGGEFSGRMTAPFCVLGGMCLQVLDRHGIKISAYIAETGDIEKAIEDGDSVGGIVECQIDGLPAGIGGPNVSGLESRLSRNIFAIPAVKGIEFGIGFAAANLRGSECNDEFIIEDGKVVTRTNNCGGILGGISTGMPIIFRVAFKPTPSISKEQKTVNLKALEETTICISGRHDPCVVPRALPVVEAMAAITITEILQEEKKL